MIPAPRFSDAKRLGRVVAQVIAFGGLLTLPACIPPLRSAETQLALPSEFNGSPNGDYGAQISGESSAENSAQLRVDEFYNDPTLSRLICQALITNREVKILEEEIQIAGAQIVFRQGAILPTVSLGFGAGLDKNSRFTPLGAAEEELEYLPERHFPKFPGDFLLGLNYSMPIDLWRELRNAKDAAGRRYLASIERRNAFITKLVAEIAENYYGLMALDTRLATLDQIIGLLQRSLAVARANFAAGRGTALAIQRFQAEVGKNQSEKLLVRQEIVELENRINLALGRLPQPVTRNSTVFFDMGIQPLSLGVPSQLLRNRPDIRQAELELEAAGLNVLAARAKFFPKLDITGGIGTAAFNPKYLFDPESLALRVIGELSTPIINRAAIRAEYLAANAEQLQALYNYQRIIIDATIEVVNHMSMVQNYTGSIELRRNQLKDLEASVDSAGKLFQAARGEYVDVLFSQRDLLEARTVLIGTRRQQLAAVVNVYRALGGGTAIQCPPPDAAKPEAAKPDADKPDAEPANRPAPEAK